MNGASFIFPRNFTVLWFYGGKSPPEHPVSAHDDDSLLPNHGSAKSRFSAKIECERIQDSRFSRFQALKTEKSTPSTDMRSAKLYYFSATHVTAHKNPAFDCAMRSAKLYYFSATHVISHKNQVFAFPAGAILTARTTTKDTGMSIAKLYSFSASHTTAHYGWMRILFSFAPARQIKKVSNLAHLTNDRVMRSAKLYSFSATHDSGLVKARLSCCPDPTDPVSLNHVPVKCSTGGHSLSTREMSLLLLILLCTIHGKKELSCTGNGSMLFNEYNTSDSTEKLGDNPIYNFCESVPRILFGDGLSSQQHNKMQPLC